MQATARQTQAALRKAAILISCLDRHNADALLDQMPPEHADRVRTAVIDLENVTPEEESEVLEEFFKSRRDVDPNSSDETSATSASLGRTHDEEGNVAASLFGGARKNAVNAVYQPPFRNGSAQRGADAQVQNGQHQPEIAEPPFEFLRDADIEVLASFLQQEHPQTIAIVLANLSTERAAALVQHFPADVQAEVLRRVVDFEETDPEIVREVEATLKSQLTNQIERETRRRQGVAAVTAILEASAPQQRKMLLNHLVGRDRELTAQITGAASESTLFESVLDGVVDVVSRSSAEGRLVQPTIGREQSASPSAASPNVSGLPQSELKTPEKQDEDAQRESVSDEAPEQASREEPRISLLFEDVERLDHESLAVVFSACDPRITLLALTGANRRFLKRIFRRLSRKDARSLRRRMDEVGPLRLRDIEESQNHVARVAGALAAAGRIRLPAATRFIAAA